MQSSFEIHPSRSYYWFVLVAHASIALAIIVYVEPLVAALTGTVLVGMLAWRETRQQRRQGVMQLKLNFPARSIELEQHGQPYFYGKYKVYANRWFAILKLIDNRTTRTLLLNPDCFNSIQSYRRLRYALQRPDRTDAA